MTKRKTMKHNPLDEAEHAIDLLLSGPNRESKAEPESNADDEASNSAALPPETQKVNYRLPKRLYLRLKVASALEGEDMQEIVVEALERTLQRREERRGHSFLPE